MTRPIAVQSEAIWSHVEGEVEPGPVSQQVKWLLAHPDLESLLRSDVSYFPRFMDRLSDLLRRAFAEGSDHARFQAHKSLYYLYEDQIGTPRPGSGINQYHPFIIRIRNELEAAWERFEADRIDLAGNDIPADPEGFAEFFRACCRQRRLDGHPLFEFLENDAIREDFVKFFLHEGMLALRFCDLMVLSMVGADEEVRSELAENFWDEVGNGRYQDRHTELYRRLLRQAGFEFPEERVLSEQAIDEMGWEGLAGYNLYLNLALHRRNYFKSVGGLGVAEMMDPWQYERIVRGCRRIRFADDRTLAYYVGHAELDVEHGDGWLEKVMLPIIRRHPEARFEIVYGALMRINTAADYYDLLYRKLTQDMASLEFLPAAKGPEITRFDAA